MGVWSNQVVPRIVELALRSDDVSERRRRCLEGLSGTVVEPGFGSGLNLAHYPDAVTKVYAVDPAMVGRKMASKRLAAASIDVEFVGLDGADLPLEDDSCDGAALTFTLCTIPDHMKALAELRRVLKPGAALHFLEHGLADDPNIAKWQNRLTPLQKRVVDGCHLNRPIVEDIAHAGFAIDWSESAFVPGPKPAAWFSIGRAINP